MANDIEQTARAPFRQPCIKSVVFVSGDQSPRRFATLAHAGKVLVALGVVDRAKI